MEMEIGSRSIAYYKEEATANLRFLISWWWELLHLHCQEFPLNPPHQSFKIITSLKWNKTLRSRENEKTVLITVITENQILIFLCPQTWALWTFLYRFQKHLLKDAVGLTAFVQKATDTDFSYLENFPTGEKCDDKQELLSACYNYILYISSIK